MPKPAKNQRAKNQRAKNQPATKPGPAKKKYQLLAENSPELEEARRNFQNFVAPTDNTTRDKAYDAEFCNMIKEALSGKGKTAKDAFHETQAKLGISVPHWKTIQPYYQHSVKDLVDRLVPNLAKELADNADFKAYLYKSGISKKESRNDLPILPTDDYEDAFRLYCKIMNPKTPAAGRDEFCKIFYVNKESLKFFSGERVNARMLSAGEGRPIAAVSKTGKRLSLSVSQEEEDDEQEWEEDEQEEEDDKQEEEDEEQEEEEDSAARKVASVPAKIGGKRKAASISDEPNPEMASSSGSSNDVDGVNPSSSNKDDDDDDTEESTTVDVAAARQRVKDLLLDSPQKSHKKLLEFVDDLSEDDLRISTELHVILRKLILRWIDKYNGEKIIMLVGTKASDSVMVHDMTGIGDFSGDAPFLKHLTSHYLAHPKLPKGPKRPTIFTLANAGRWFSYCTADQMRQMQTDFNKNRSSVVLEA